jgi:hypothetical protein
MSIVTHSSIPFIPNQTKPDTRTAETRKTMSSEESSALGEVYAIFMAVAERVRNERTADPTDNVL